jgi:hypothetical protein
LPSPAEPPTGAAPTPRAEDARALEDAERAWTAGDASRVRSILEPLAADPERLGNPEQRRTALLLLADSTLSDTSIDEPTRRGLAEGHLARLLRDDPGFTPAADLYRRPLYTLLEDVRRNFEQAEAKRCIAERQECRADLSDQGERLAALEQEHSALVDAYGKQEVIERNVERRSRGLALLPLGIGHFYNGEPGLGAAFLVAEAGFGAAGLALLIRRTTVDGCVRTDGFRRGSLDCDSDDSDGIQRRRKAEEVMAWALVGTVLVDIVVAQVRFRPLAYTGERRTIRQDLDATPAPPPPRRRRRATVTPSPVWTPGGGGAGVRVRF